MNEKDRAVKAYEVLMAANESHIDCRNPGMFSGNRKRLAEVRDAFDKGYLKVTTVDRHRSFGQHEFADPQSTRTYDECINMAFSKGKLTILIFDGSMVDGFPRDKRVTFTLEGQWQEIEFLRGLVFNRLTHHAAELLKKEAEAERNHRINMRVKLLMGESE